MHFTTATAHSSYKPPLIPCAPFSLPRDSRETDWLESWMNQLRPGVLLPKQYQEVSTICWHTLLASSTLPPPVLRIALYV
jgi:hypothetical protein